MRGPVPGVLQLLRLAHTLRPSLQGQRSAVCYKENFRAIFISWTIYHKCAKNKTQDSFVMFSYVKYYTKHITQNTKARKGCISILVFIK